jgi:hypothetical protein
LSGAGSEASPHQCIEKRRTRIHPTAEQTFVKNQIFNVKQHLVQNLVFSSMLQMWGTNILIGLVFENGKLHLAKV